MVVAAALWWSYFDWVIYISQARLAEATGAERADLARDLFSYLHMPMVFGIVLFALGMKETLGHVDEPLGVIPAVGLCGGLALYMAAHVALRLRIGGGWGHGRPIATVALLALIPVATVVPALVALAPRGDRLRDAHRVRSDSISVRALLDPEPPRRVHDGGGRTLRGTWRRTTERSGDLDGRGRRSPRCRLASRRPVERRWRRVRR